MTRTHTHTYTHAVLKGSKLALARPTPEDVCHCSWADRQHTTPHLYAMCVYVCVQASCVV